MADLGLNGLMMLQDILKKCSKCVNWNFVLGYEEERDLVSTILNVLDP
jgi:hypothetical protein